ncbi:thiamine pyrophosphate-binding protein [Thermoplasma sp.]|uniref:thiamine pyrophosphate-binding protein n=1 Tax=Thermoplasma sp. TaxID=1973142 RepID=UPI002634F355|nr:thiamine pyrophosphate-binding protein [Thermoplasma sp.]
MSRITGGEILKRILEKENVRYVFGVPGDQLYPFLNAIYDSDIKFITFHDEAAAAHAADAWARTTGEIGVVTATVGPGVANLVGGIYPASSENIPMLVITAQNQTFRSYPDHGSMQALDQYSLLHAVTKWNAVINSWNRITEITERAIRMAFYGSPGPVHIDIPSDILHQTGEENDVKIKNPNEYRATGRIRPDDETVKMICEEIRRAKRPLIHAGGGVLRSGASEELLELAELMNIPVTTSISGRGSIPEDHRLALIPQSYGAINAQSEADLVIVLGSKLGDLDFFGRPPIWGDLDKQRFIQIDISGEQIGMNRPVTIGAVGDIKATLRSIIERLKAESAMPEEREYIAIYKDLEKQWTGQFEEYMTSDAVPMHPLRVIAEVRSFYPRDSIAVIDGGNTTVWSHYANRVFLPNTFLSSSAGDSGYIGTGIAYAIAAKLARPRNKVYCITGDGSFGYNVSELETARRLGIHFTCVVLNDDSWGMIKSGQTLYYDKRYVGVDFGSMDYAEIAKGMGCFGETVRTPSELKEGLRRAEKSNLPAVLDVKIEKGLTPPDFQTLAEIWLEGCEPPPKEIKQETTQIIQ